MNLSFIIGILAGFGLVIYGIFESGDGPSQVVNSFINIPSMYITFGGAISATIMSVPVKYLKDIPQNMKVLMKKEKINLNLYIDAIEELAKEARLKGLLILEEKVNNIDLQDEFLKYCVMLIVDAIEPTKVRAQIENEIDCIEARHASAWKVFDTLGSFGPAFGMLGTLVGLINMLANMNPAEGADALGRGMSVALVTTFYGSFLANMICAPISNRLKAKHDEEMVAKELIMEGVLSIQSGENPKYIREKLNSYITYKDRGLTPTEGYEESTDKKSKRGLRKKKSKA
ncbi:MotA/TolQ/ExbB proton channel family protein [Sedimentibacter hydroxybenzoicus DSM 7310]|uniref:MotA/TolQ/ExbB proton channel family protein n=1 Tax=Sedimentibacter hydroxybenzoicus DSM 7310 TaxID=1123245 RepID=A0A974BGD5_SEDHY|nr:MotA/TolQ/ExbB proton channel family protein [Sedimentibacter hydroxybenzoicus]NYB72600.1 MotA/TolQ/ExbB proton channel family protein [Sedimentibacter hydroxybenzoicus DSM 7310]